MHCFQIGCRPRLQKILSGPRRSQTVRSGPTATTLKAACPHAAFRFRDLHFLVPPACPAETGEGGSFQRRRRMRASVQLWTLDFGLWTFSVPHSAIRIPHSDAGNQPLALIYLVLNPDLIPNHNLPLHHPGTGRNVPISRISGISRLTQVPSGGPRPNFWYDLV
jgi:hypothetical protein